MLSYAAMVERLVDKKALEEEALGVVQRLKDVAQHRERTYSSDIQAVLVFSGPGTYYDRLKPGQEEWKRWMDRDRIRAGVAVVREITARRVLESFEKEYALTVDYSSRLNLATKEDILRQGPFLVYNGIPTENEVFRQAFDSPHCKLPKEKVVVIDEVREEDGKSHPIRHTGDQVKSFYQQLRDPNGPLYRVKNVALVAHVPDFVRIPFYTKKYNDEHLASGGASVNFWTYGLRSRPASTDPRLQLESTEKPHIESELPRLIQYAQKGDLATEPSPFRT